MGLIEEIQSINKYFEERCPEVVMRPRGWCCRVTERPSGRIQNCPKEYGGECPMEEENEETL